jgi:hypothetical protein
MSGIKAMHRIGNTFVETDPLKLIHFVKSSVSIGFTTLVQVSRADGCHRVIRYNEITTRKMTSLSFLLHSDTNFWKTAFCTDESLYCWRIKKIFTASLQPLSTLSPFLNVNRGRFNKDIESIEPI